VGGFALPLASTEFLEAQGLSSKELQFLVFLDWKELSGYYELKGIEKY
jgi:hypothetical protein